ncbi:MAG: sacsin N-terminal ATP-binding-like domain-containing protein [Acidimicrobiales bacterium]
MTVTGTEADADGRGASPVGGPPGPEEAARLLFQDPRADVDFTPRNDEEARRAVEEFARLFETAPGVFKNALEGARAGAETLSGDPLQGLAEIIQNADDAGASYVRFQVVGDHFIAVHNGADVTLSDVLALATPWLSNKTDNELATGRFGIGLMTLRALSDVLDVHSGPYHIRLGDPTIGAITPEEFSGDLAHTGETALCLPLRSEGLDTEDIAAWLGRWDDSALLFLRSVRDVTVVDPDDTPVRTLHLEWDEDEPTRCRVAGHGLTVQRRHATAPDGRRWLVQVTEAPRPPDVRRVRKAAGATVPLGLALALQPGDRGVIYAGLPIVDTAVPLRVNAQFDPITSRTGLAPTRWNSALLPMLADLWVEVVEDLLAERPVAAWDVIPLPDETDQDDGTRSVVGQIENLLLERARTELAASAALVVDGQRVALSELAVEDEALTGVVEPAEVAQLAGLEMPLPASARDEADRWRDVLDDWRGAGAPLSEPVTVEDALTLLDNPNRSVETTIALTAVALDEGLAAQLAGLPCVSTSDGLRIVPPTADSVQALMLQRSRLAEQLGMGVGLAPEHLAETDPAKSVLAWLRETGAVIDDAGNEEVVRRLAAAGRADECLPEPLTDEQLRALRDAFEQLPASERSSLGRDVGHAITIAAFRYSARGQVERLSARPADLYLSRAIDREQDSFAVAADRTPGLLWSANRYADQLRSSLGRLGGLGPQKFLGLLGAERAPRIVLHASLENRYLSDRRWGLPVGAAGSPKQRGRAMWALGASYALDDLDSPDLRAVVDNIARERKATRRRERAGALLGALGRAWDRLADQADVDAALTDYVWRVRGTTKAFWLWSVGATAWLDDTDGVPQAPLDLRLKTAGTIAVHGADAPGYLRPEFDASNRREILAALGVSGEPKTRDLVERLRELRAARPVPDTVATDAAIVYQALADRIHGRVVIPGDLTERELRTAFGDGDGLVYTNLGWRVPTDVLGGDPVFRRRHAFVPQVPRGEPLWRTLQIRQPSTEDCLRVIGQVARTRRAPEDDDVLVLLETLRLLAERIAARPEMPRRLIRRLASMSLWTTRGWTTGRPVYAVDDPALIEGLRTEVPVWDPGGDVAQFESLLVPLKITRLGAEATTVIDPEAAVRDDDAGELFGAAVSLLQEDLVRNDPRTAGALALPWDRLRDFEVRVDDDLRVRVDGLVGRAPVEIEVATKADVTAGVLFLRDERLLRQVDGGGRAVAGLFAAADRRRIAQAWLAAYVAAEEGRTAQRLLLAEQEAAEERARREQEMAERAASLGQDIAGRQQGRSRRRPGRPAGSGATADGAEQNDGQPQPQPQPPASPPPRPRVLVDPSTLGILNPDGRPGGGAPGGSGRRRRRSSGPLPPPNRNAGALRGRTSAPGFTDLDKETVGMDLARLVLAGDEDEIADLRAQRGVGADAVDSLDNFFELKVHLGDEPDVIRLEESEIRRALSTPNFFLVVVSNVEGADARPKVRIIVDPVHQLAMTQASSVSFTGVRGAEHSLVYELGPLEDGETPDA